MQSQDDIFYQALLAKDSSFEGTFIVGVKTTGIFCRPTCTARKPKRENVEFFPSSKEAILKGYRACKVCHPMEQQGQAPEYIARILQRLEESPTEKIKDYHLRDMGTDPVQVRRWFQKQHRLTFHAYQRMYRINNAFRHYQQGHSIADIAHNAGYESLSGFNSSFKNIIGTSPTHSKHALIIHLTRIETPLGTMLACASAAGICLLGFSDRKMLETELKQLAKHAQAPLVQAHNPHFDILRQQLQEYFQGIRKEFTVPLDPVGTAFQQEVWKVLLQIPYGTTSSYARQAALLGKPTAIRAVANANGMNKIAIIIPCHRVVGSDGALTGYSGGLWRKQRLLELEAQYHRLG